MSEYQVISTEPHTYMEKGNGVINGVLIRFRIPAYDEIHEVRIPKMDTAMAKKAIEKLVSDRDALAELG